MQHIIAIRANTKDTAWFPATRRFLGWLQHEALGLLALMGQAALYLKQSLRFLLHGQLKWSETLTQCQRIGLDTLPMALVMTTFFGMVIALQVATEMKKQGTADYVGALVSLAMVRELSPIMTAFSVSALAGSAMAAELGAMSIKQQIDALRMLRVDPARYCVLPRVIAGMTMLPVMVVITTISGILGGMVVSQLTAGVNPGVYLDSVFHQTEWRDVFACLVKASVFGVLISTLSSTVGLTTQGGAKAVGESATRAVVWSFMAMAVCDYLLTLLIYGTRSS